MSAPSKLNDWPPPPNRRDRSRRSRRGRRPTRPCAAPRRTRSRLVVSPSTSYAAEISLKRLLGVLVALVGVGVELLGELLVGARELLVGRARRNAEHRVVVLLEPLSLCCHELRRLILVTFTIAGRSTRPFNFHPVRNTSPTCGSPVAFVLQHGFVLVRVERRTERVDALETRPAPARRRTRRRPARFPCAPSRRRRRSRLQERELEAVEHGQQLLDKPSVARSTSAVCSRNTRLR